MKMKLEKGDLIAIRTLNDKRCSAIVILPMEGHRHIYCYVIDTNSNQMVYQKEIEFLISKNFNPDIEFGEDQADLDYYFYELYMHRYFHNFYHLDDDEDDE